VISITTKGQGTITYSKVSGNQKIAINQSTGKVTVKKGLKKGTYKVKVKVKAAGNANYKASAWKTVTFSVIVK
jgi:endo-1,4-beta-xylanase